MNLKKLIEKENIKLPDNFFYKIQKYKENLFKWNKIHNLTGAKDEETVNLFIFDALFPLTFLLSVKSVMDIGTGAGFPGIILAIALPDTKFSLVEPLSKKASFLQFIKADLKLENVTVVKKKVQDMDAQIFELITSRAVMQTKQLLDLCKKFRDKKTLLLFYKGERVFEELDKSIKYKIIKTKNRHYLLINGDKNDS